MDKGYTDLIIDSFSDRKDLVCVSDELAQYSGKECLSQVGNRTSNLYDIGVVGGMCILVQADRGSSFWFDMLAVCSLGAVAVPVDLRMGEEVIGTVQKETGANICLSDPEKIPPAEAGIKLIDASLKNEGNDYRLPSESVRSVGGRDVAIILYTSGTTGKPKGVPLTHQAITNNLVETSKIIGLTGNSRLLVPIPYRYVSALSHFLVSQYSRAEFIGVEKKLSESDLITMILNSGANSIGGSPLQVKWISDSADQLGQRLEWIMSSGGHLASTVIEEVFKRFDSGICVVSAYGLTEVAGRLCINVFKDAESTNDSVGKPLKNYSLSVNVSNATNEDNDKSDLTGELIVESSYLFSGYLGLIPNPTTSDGKFVFGTGDLAKINGSGAVNLTGRTDDVIKCSGLKVNLKVIESALFRKNYFSEFAVIGMPDDTFGHIPCVAYTDVRSEDFKKGQVIRELKQILPMNHVPRTFFKVGSIPRTGTGKIQKQLLLNLINV